MSSPPALSPKLAACAVCKSPSIEASRASCPTCLINNLQRACYMDFVPLACPSRVGPSSASKAAFPGMPRIVTGPVFYKRAPPISGPHRLTEACHDSTLLLEDRAVGAMNDKTEADAFAGLASVEIIGQNIVQSDEFREDDRNGASDELDKDLRASEVKRFSKEDVSLESNSLDKECFVQPELESLCKTMESADNGLGKWHLFQIRKNLTVKIPHPPTEAPKRAPACLKASVAPSSKNASVPLPAGKETCGTNTTRSYKAKRWPIRPDTSAEADLMMRLLADTIPILKSRNPLVLPPCPVRPAPPSPPSSPGDPLWKRRCIPCPRSLKVLAPLVSAN